MPELEKKDLEDVLSEEELEEMKKKMKEDEDDDDDDESDNEKAKDKKKDDDDEMDEGKKKYKKEDFQISTSDLNLKEDIDSLFDNEEISEELKDKLVTVYETSVSAKVNEIVEAVIEGVESHFEEEFESSLEEALEEMTDVVKEHLQETTEAWFEENKIVVENSIRAEIAESFVSDLRELFEKHNIDVDEEKIDVINEVETQIEEANEIIDRKTRKINDLEKENMKMKKVIVIDYLSEGLSESEKSKFLHLSEAIDINLDEEVLLNKLETIKNHYFGKKTEIISLEEGDNFLCEEENNDTNNSGDERYPGIERTTEIMTKIFSNR